MTKGQLVLNIVLEQGSGKRRAGFSWPIFGCDGVSVMPVREGATELIVGKVMTPGEGSDFCLPMKTERRKRERAEAYGKPGSCASC